MKNLHCCLSELDKYTKELSPNKMADLMDEVEKLKVTLHNRYFHLFVNRKLLGSPRHHAT